MTLSFGIPIGLVIGVIGVILLFSTKYKKSAKVVLGVGAVITILTFILIVLAANSQM